MVVGFFIELMDLVVDEADAVELQYSNNFKSTVSWSALTLLILRGLYGVSPLL